MKQSLIIILLVFLIGIFFPFFAFADEPIGTGFWIYRAWEEDFWLNPDSLISKLNKSGITWITIKAGDGDSLWNNPERNQIEWIFANISKFHNFGIKVYGWQYVYGDDEKWQVANISEADVANQILDIDGIDGLIIDAESEYKTTPGNQSKASAYLNAIYQRHPNAFLMYTTFARSDSHSSFPFSVFNQYTKAVLPQVYWGDRTPRISPREEIEIMKTQWSKISPQILIYPLASLSNATVEELREFANTISNYGFKNPSFWRYGIATQSHFDYFYETSIYKIYEELLGREPDLSGLFWYIGLLNQGWNTEQVRAEIESSIEYKTRKISLLYQELLARIADSDGLSWYLSLVQNKGWNFAKVEEDIKDSSEYKIATLKKIYREFLGREVDEGGLSWYLSLVNKDWSFDKVRDSIKFSLEYRNYQLQIAFRELLFRAVDADGLALYTNLMLSGWTIEQVRDDIKKSNEYIEKHLQRKPLF